MFKKHQFFDFKSFVLVSLLALAALSLFLYLYVVDIKKHSLIHLSVNYLDSIQKSLEQKVKKSFTDFESLVHDDVTRDFFQGENAIDQMQSYWLQAAYRFQGLKELRYLGNNGESVRLLAAAGEYFVVPQYVVNNEVESFSYQNLSDMKVGRTYLSQLNRVSGDNPETPSNKINYSIARKVWHMEQQSFGYIIATFDIQELLRTEYMEDSMFSIFLLNRTGSRWVDASGRMLEEQKIENFLQGKSLGDFLFEAEQKKQSAVLSDNRVMAVRNLENISYSTLVPSKDFPWKTLVVFDARQAIEANPAMFANNYMTLIFLMVFVFFSICFSYVFSLIFKQHKLKQQLHDGQNVMQEKNTLLSSVDEGLLLIGADSKIVFANAAAQKMLNFELGSLVGKSVSQVFPAHVMASFFQRDFWRVTECQVSLSAKENKDSRKTRVLQLKSSYVNDKFCIRCKDISAQLEQDNQLNYVKKYDAVSQVMTRLAFETQLTNKFLSSGVRGCLCYLDFDDFRSVNQGKGFTVGDNVLFEAGKRLKALVKKTGYVARVGGDEFVIFSEENFRPSAVKSFASQVVDILSEQYAIEDKRISLSVSLGVCVAPEGGESPQQLMRSAEKAMQKAKRAGGGQYILTEDHVQSADSGFLELGREIRQAIKQDEFVLYYQPVFDLDKRSIKSFEALLRWDNKERGLLPPAYFLEHLENSRLIVDVGFDVLRKACQFIARINSNLKRPVRVSVNLSPRQFMVKNLMPRLREILMETECSPAWLDLEISENALLRNTDAAAEVVKKLRNLGVYISIDDFGTGYSSLDYLKKLEVDQLKIDKTFVTNAQVHNEDKAILEFTTFLAKKLSLSVVAEGVEVVETDKLLQELGIHTGQGYFYAKPMSEHKAEKFVVLHYGNRTKPQVLRDQQKQEKVVNFPLREF